MASTQSSSNSTATSSKWRAVVYANNAPPPAALLAADLKADVAQRFSVPLQSVNMMDVAGKVIPEQAEIASLEPKMVVTIEQANGQVSTYETEMIM